MLIIFILNQLIGLYRLFSVFLFLTDITSCKNEMASKQIDLIFEDQKQQQNALKTHSISISTAQQDDGITSAGNSKPLQADPKQPDQAPPKFELEDTTIKAGTTQSIRLEEITINAGTTQSIRLKANGNTEGYIIKSISISKNGTYCTGKFGITEDYKKRLKQPIPPTGLPITLTTNPRQQDGYYELKLKIGKTGKGSRPTEQWVECTIQVINDKAKNEKQNESCSAKQTIAAYNSNTMVQNDCPSKDEADASKNIDEDASKNIAEDDFKNIEADASKNITKDASKNDRANPSKNIAEEKPQNDTTSESPSVGLKDITIKVGTTKSITLEIIGITEEYVIKTISLKKTNTNNYHTPKLGLNRLKGEAIGNSGITFPLPEQFPLKPGAYVLRITVAKNEKNSKTQAFQCTVTVS